MPWRIPDDWTVWAFSDAHGVLDGLVESLYRAGLIDELGHWSAAPATALVGVGDYVDRGPDSAGVVKFLSRLSAGAAAAASRVILVRGNHEQMLLELLRGDPGCFLSWMSNGGRAFLASYGHPDPKFGPPLATLLDTEANGLMDWLSATLPYAVWGDVLLVHASPVAGGRLATLEEGDQQMWSAAQYCERAPKVQRDRHEKYRGERGQPSIAAPSRGDGTWARIRYDWPLMLTTVA